MKVLVPLACVATQALGCTGAFAPCSVGDSCCMSFGTYSCQEVSGYRSPWVCYPDSGLLNMQAEQSEPKKTALLNMEGCKAPGAPCSTENNDINCCYAFGTYKCMGDPGKQKC